MNNRRLKALICALVIVVSFIPCTGCNSNEKTGKVNNEISETEVIDEGTKKINFFKNGIFQYNIIFPESYNDEEVAVVKNSVFAKVRKINNKRPNFYKDSVTINNEFKCIYIGNTVSDYSAKALNILEEKAGKRFEATIITVIDENIVMNAGSLEALENVLEWFDSNILVSEDATISNGYTRIEKGYENDNMVIAGTNISDFIINCEEYPSQMAMRGSEELQKTIKEVTGFEVPILKGYNDNYLHRIVVTEKGEDRSAYSVTVTENGNVEVVGGHDYSVNAALHMFAKAISESGGKKKLNIPAGTVVKDNYNDKTLNSDGYRLTWAEEFDDKSLKGWTINGDSENTYKCKITKDSVGWEDGKLVITCRPTKLKDGTDAYTAGQAEYLGMTYAYGYFEIRAKLPRGNGNWPSFWMKQTMADKPDTEKFTIEIDVFESFGIDGVLKSQLHSWWSPDIEIAGLQCSEAQQESGHIQHFNNGTNGLDGGNEYTLPCISEGKSIADDWHTYGCEWTPAYMKFYCDGYCYYTQDMRSDLVDSKTGEKLSEYMLFTSGNEVSFYLWNMLGAKFNKIAVDETTEIPSKFIIDYVHLYQIDGLGKMTWK